MNPTARARRELGSYAVYLAAALYFCWPLFEKPNGLGMMDWDQHFFYYGSVLKSVFGFTQPPFWNPWYCGGNVLWQNPQIAILSPVYLLSAVMSLPLAMKINITLHYFACFVGMHLLLTRVFRITFLPVVLFLGGLYALCGGIALHLAVGHSTFLCFLYLPFVVYFVLRAFETGAIRDAILAGLVYALAIWNGGIHAVALSGLALGLVAVVAAIIRRDWRPLALLLVVGAATVLYAAPKLFPVAAFLTSPQFWDTRMGVDTPDTMRWSEVLHALVDPSRPPEVRGWWEYGNYIGLLGSLVIAASFVTVLVGSWRRERWRGLSLALAAPVFLALARGQYSPSAPFALLQHLPIFAGFRNPGRYSIIFVLVGVALAGAALQTAVRGLTLSTAAKRWLGVIVLLASFDVASHNRAYFEGAVAREELGADVRPFAAGATPVFDWVTDPYGPDSPMFRALAGNRMAVNCYEVLQTRRGVAADRALIWSPGATKVSSIVFTPNRIEATVIPGPDEARVFLNQNYIDGWKSSAGPVRFDPGSGQGYVVVPRDYVGKVTFSYTPPWLWTGFALFAIGIVLSRLVWRRSLGAPVQAV